MEIRASSLFFEVLKGFQEKSVLPDFPGFYRILCLNVLPLFYQRAKMFYQVVIQTILLTKKTKKYYVIDINYI